MFARPYLLVLALVSSLMSPGYVLAQKPGYAPPPPPIPPLAEPDPIDQWLEEVRAQRQAWEERRRAAKEARDARRRWIDPWGAAQKEAREEKTRRRREAFREQIEREREAFVNQSPWATQGPRPGTWQTAPGNPDAGASRERGDAGGEAPLSGAEVPATPYLPLPDWNNGWYYRGY